MRRRSTILDVLRDARQDAAARPAPEPVAPEGGGLAGLLGWFRARVTMSRGALAVGALFVLGLVWGAYRLGGAMVPEPAEAAAQRGERPIAPGPMHDSRTRPASADVGGNTPEPGGARGESRERRVPLGFRIVTYDPAPQHRDKAQAMVAHLNRHLDGTGAEARWIVNRRDGKWVVLVALPPDRREDPAYRERVLEAIRRVPAPDPREVVFDFAKVQARDLVYGIVR